MTFAWRIPAVAVAALAAIAPLSDARAQARKAEPTAPLASFLADTDYPDSAIRSGEQGAVSFRLVVGTDGSVIGCEVLASSGSITLDSTTCQLMAMRARFRPAADSSGKPVQGAFEGRIVWRLPDIPFERVDLPERPSAAIRLWQACTDGEAAKLVLSALGAAEISARAFGACAPLEAQIVRELVEWDGEATDASRTVQAIKDDFAGKVGPWAERTRSALGQRSPTVGKPERRPSAGK